MSPLPSTRTAAAEVPSGAFRILAVCTGNICRSPLIEAALRQRLADALGGEGVVAVASAGTAALVDAPVDADARVEAERLRLDVSGHRGRLLERSTVHESGLIVAATRAHRAAIVDLDPSAMRRAFTLLELDAILASLDVDDVPVATSDPVGTRLTAIVSAAATRRGLVTTRPGLELDLRDPYRLGRHVHEEVAAMLDASTARVAARLLAATRDA